MASSGKGSRPQGRGGSGGAKDSARRVSSSTRVSRNGRSNSDATAEPVVVSDLTAAPPPRRRFLSRRNVIIGVLALVVLLVAGVALYTWFTINKSLPTLNGNVQVPGLTA